MEIKFNSTFKTLIDKYNLPIDLSFQVDLPTEVQQKLSDEIIINEFGLGLESNWEPYLYGKADEQSFHEDDENHFHVDWYIDNITDKKAFELGVKTLVELARRFQNENINNVQLTYSFQTPEMGQMQAKENNIDDDEHLISDRLSFHTKRPGQIVVHNSLFNNKHFAFLTIDL
jgi:hypothetical protein